MGYAEIGVANADDTKVAKINYAFIKKASIRVIQISDTEDQNEYGVCRAILDGVYPATWPQMVFVALDAQGVLATSTDTEIDGAVDVTWPYILNSRR